MPWCGLVEDGPGTSGSETSVLRWLDFFFEFKGRARTGAMAAAARMNTTENLPGC